MTQTLRNIGAGKGQISNWHFSHRFPAHYAHFRRNNPAIKIPFSSSSGCGMGAKPAPLKGSQKENSLTRRRRIRLKPSLPGGADPSFPSPSAPLGSFSFVLRGGMRSFPKSKRSFPGKDEQKRTGQEKEKKTETKSCFCYGR